ncbi:tyrosine-type recombinase/integrase [Ramlibacter sp.]|uniref:tyrosine-type recombinase/integrase n=1 Tax=Ramlibacter sp. TaxID=1917967 RepID=UPI003D0C7B8A
MKRYLTETEQRQLLLSAKRTADPLAQRDYHWMAALILTGMRIQEWSRLTSAQVRLALHNGWLVSLKEHCKGKRHANDYLVTHPLRQHLQALLALSDELAAHLELSDGQMQPLVWGRDRNGVAGALSVRSYEARLKQWATAAGLDGRISPHWLRHTRGMNIMRRSRGKDALRVAKLALNHQSLRSTGIYTQMSREEYENEIRIVDGGRVPRRFARAIALSQGAA